VHVQVKPLVIVFRGRASCGFSVHVPVDFALRTHDYGPGISHTDILAGTRVSSRRAGADSSREHHVMVDGSATSDVEFNQAIAFIIWRAGFLVS
jgi:hypothetical protein